ncbi:type II secretion system protein [bacterium]|nr:type II secretion system protein [bacterium]
MNSTPSAGSAACRTARRGGFTLVELLVVISVITILAAMMMPSLLKGISSATTADCVSRARQITAAYMAYSKDYNMIMMSGGDGTDEHQESWVWPQGKNAVEWYAPVADFPYWYQTLAKSQGIGEEIFACPAKASAAVGYGYNHVAPYGTSLLYRVENKDIHKQVWTYTTVDYQPGADAEVSYTPVNNKGAASPIKILWYRQCAAYGSIASPSSTIAFCDTGRIINDTALTTDPTKWREDQTSNAKGYTRFPLCDTYTADDRYKGAGSYTDTAWRPIGRHGGKVVCTFFDGNTQAVPVRDVVGPRWFDAACLFDNRSPDYPPIKKVWQ